MIDTFSQYVNDLKKDLKTTASGNIGMLGVYRFTLENPDGSTEVKFFHNVIPIVGRAMIANNLTDPTPDNDMLISHAVLGSSTTAPNENDTQLGTEVYRNAIASKTNLNDVAYATAFFNQTEVSGTFKEAGIVSDGTGTANTGILVSHVAIDVTKTTVQKLTIDWTLALTSI